VLKALMWALLFGESIIVFYDGKEEKSNKWRDSEKLFLKGGEQFIKCKAFYEEINNNGYYIQEVDNFFGTPTTYRITLTAYKSKQSVVYYADAATRVVRFSAPQMELKYSGTSSVSTIAKDCLIQELIKRATAVQAMNTAGGVLACRVAGEEEKTLLDAELGTTLTHLKRIYVSGNMAMEELFKIVTPDLKVDQLTTLNELMQQDIATGIDMSISNLEGAPQGALSSAEYDTFNTYSKVKQLQSHFHRAFEESFYKLGKKNTEFEFYDPTPVISAGEQPTNDGTTKDTTSETGGNKGSTNSTQGKGQGQREGTNN
jgi:hypothetical protein